MRLGSLLPALLRWPLLGTWLIAWCAASWGQTPDEPPAAPVSLATGAQQVAGKPTLDEYQAELRRLFALRDYTKVLSVADEVDRFYPGQEIVAYYRNHTLKKMEEAKEAEARYRRMRDRPIDVPPETPEPTPLPPRNQTRSETATSSPTAGQTRDVAMAAPTASAPIAESTEGPKPSTADAWKTESTSGSSARFSEYLSNPIVLGGAALGLIVIAFVVVALKRRASEEDDAEEIVIPAPKPAAVPRERPSNVMGKPKAERQGRKSERPSEPMRRAEPFAPPPDYERTPPLEPSFESTSFDNTVAPEMPTNRGWELELEKELEAQTSTPPLSPPDEVDFTSPDEETLTFRKTEPAKPEVREDSTDLPLMSSEDSISIGGTKIRGAVPLERPEHSTSRMPREGADELFSNMTLPPAERAPWETDSETDTDIRLTTPPPAPAPPPAAEPQISFPPLQHAQSEPEPEPIKLESVMRPVPEFKATENLSAMTSPESWDTEPGLTAASSAPASSPEDSAFIIEREEAPPEDTQTSWNRGSEETVGMSYQELAKDPDLILPPAPGEQPGVQVFHQDETVQVNLRSAAESWIVPQKSEPAPKKAAEDTQTGIELDSQLQDPFERARQLGLEFFQEARWDQAVHHLSVAAALRPEAADVKEKLRQARRMRKS
jgi:hypothetical protein